MTPMRTVKFTPPVKETLRATVAQNSRAKTQTQIFLTLNSSTNCNDSLLDSPPNVLCFEIVPSPPPLPSILLYWELPYVHPMILALGDS